MPIWGEVTVKNRVVADFYSLFLRKCTKNYCDKVKNRV